MPATVLFINTRPTPLEAYPCFYAARQLGLDVVLLADRPIDEFAEVAAEVAIVDTFDLDATVAAAAAVARRRSVVGAVTWADRDVEAVARITEILGLPGNPPAAAATARNKGRLREVLLAHAPDLVPAFHVVRTEEDLDAALRSVPMPAILKPTGASGSKGIFAVEDSASLRSAFAELMQFTRPEKDPIFCYYPGELVLEERVFGTEHSVEGIVQCGEIRTLTVTDKWVRMPFFLEHLQIQPSRLPSGTAVRVREAAARTVRLVGLRDGAFHLELKVTEEGQPVVLELNGRTGGGFITSHLIKTTTGYDFYREVLRGACALGEVKDAPEPFCAAGSIQVITPAEGIFEGFSNLGQVLSIPGIIHFTYELPPGQRVAQPPASFTTPVLASFVAQAATPATVEKLLLHVDDTIAPVLR